MNTTKLQLQKLIDVNTPIIYIQDYDYVRVDELIFSAVVDNGDKEQIEEWNPALGLVNFYTKRCANDVFLPLEQVLSYRYNRSKSPKDRFLVIKDPKESLESNQVLSFLIHMAQRKLYDPNFHITVILVSAIEIPIPREIEKYVSYLDIPYPTDEEINEIINRHIEVNNYADKFQDEDRQKLMPTLKGMSALEIDRMLDMAMSSNGSLSGDDTEMILQQKKQMIKNSGLLELIDTPESLDSIGGMNALKDYLKKKSKIMQNLPKAQAQGLVTPKGVMLVGMPGCGKSLCAKASAAVFQVPLMRLDMGSMMGKYVGESEGNLRRAIKIAEAAAPCILWIDEIEKAFSGVGSGSESYTTRMFGYFLSWLQDKTSSVYVIATANSADSLPPELKRKGRFDEIFCVNLPNEEECKAIFEVHLKKGRRKELYGNTSISKELLNHCKTKGFNGADIASVVNEAIEDLFVSEEKSDLSSLLLKVAKNTVCIKESCSKQIDAMKKAFEENSFIDASSGKKSK